VKNWRRQNNGSAERLKVLIFLQSYKTKGQIALLAICPSLFAVEPLLASVASRRSSVISKLIINDWLTTDK